jgi:putative glutamine amidotransferase
VTFDTNFKDLRTEFEMAIFRKFYDLDKPILGICNGEQVINVALGGTLIQHIPDEVENAITHKQSTPKHLPSHECEVLDISKLYKIVGQPTIEVNSTHHQSVKDLGKNLVISAIAEDGVIEAIECTSKRFCLGVQWHPEYTTTESDKKLIEFFVNEVKNNKTN